MVKKKKKTQTHFKGSHKECSFRVSFSIMQGKIICVVDSKLRPSQTPLLGLNFSYVNHTLLCSCQFCHFLQDSQNHNFMGYRIVAEMHIISSVRSPVRCVFKGSIFNKHTLLMLLNWCIWSAAELSVWQRPVLPVLLAGSVCFPQRFLK